MEIMKFKSFLCFVCACAAMPAGAQAEAPSTDQMIEQLKKPSIQTRGLSRNLEVQRAPSLSLLIQFDFDSARIRPESQQPLTNLARALQSPELQRSKFAVEGHTDAKGSVDYNLKLSAQRAQAVRYYLKTQGVDEDRLVASGKGSSELANDADPLAAENRRVRIVNLN